MDSVDRMGDLLAILRQVQNSGYVSEADEKPDDQGDTPPPETDSVDQPGVDKDIEDLMTTPKQPGSNSINVDTLADDLGLPNPGAFTAAFDLLRSGSTVDDPVLVGSLANAFVRLMVSDASTTQRVLNRLRREYKTPPSA